MLMFEDCISYNIINNGKLILTRDISIPDGSRQVYEVLRVIDGVPIFLSDHIERLLISINSIGEQSELSKNEWSNEVLKFIYLEGIQEGNIKLFYTIHEGQHYRYIYSSQYHYPDANYYEKGVSTDLFYAERVSPTIKQVHALQKQMSEFRFTRNIYEAILVNRNGEITEGSRSNIFFQVDNTFYTAPQNAVLAGITRKYVIDAIHSCGYILKEQFINVSDLHKIESAFITGTSPKVLPIASIGDISLKVGGDQQLYIMAEYDRILKEFIFTEKNNKWKGE